MKSTGETSNYRGTWVSKWMISKLRQRQHLGQAHQCMPKMSISTHSGDLQFPTIKSIVPSYKGLRFLPGQISSIHKAFISILFVCGSHLIFLFGLPAIAYLAVPSYNSFSCTLQITTFHTSNVSTLQFKFARCGATLIPMQLYCLVWPWLSQERQISTIQRELLVEETLLQDRMLCSMTFKLRTRDILTEE